MTVQSAASLNDERLSDYEKPLMAPDSFSLRSDGTQRSSDTKGILSSLRPALFTRSAGPLKLRGSTAYLDGLRGWAAFLVYITHHLLGAHMWLPLEMGWGYEGHYYFVNFPIVRTMFSGSHMAVHIFFVISGFVLSRSVLKSIHDHAGSDKIASSLASAVSRRFPRLWLPVAGTTFITMTIGYMINQEGEKQKESYLLEIANWIASITLTAYPLSTVSWMDYNAHTWTIPYEFRGSMYVFMFLLATHRMTKIARLSTIFMSACWAHRSGSFGCSTFLAGIVLAELDLLKDDEWPKWSWLCLLQNHKGKVYAVLIPFALHLAGQPALAFGSLKPQQYIDTYGYSYIGRMIPGAYLYNLNDFWHTIGAIIIVTATMNLPALRSLFEMRFTQYLGRISFGFYLVHGPVMFLLGERLYAAVGVHPAEKMPVAAWNNIWEFGKVGPIGLELNFLSCHIIMLPLTFYLAELCTKFMDDPSIKIARKLYQAALA